MTFTEFLETKKIDAHRLKLADEALYAEWEALYSQVSPASFVQQELFRINPTRRLYPLKQEAAEKPKAAAPKPKVVMRPRPKPEQ